MKQVVLKGELIWYMSKQVWRLWYGNSNCFVFYPSEKLIRTLKPKKPRQKVEIVVRCEE